MEDIFVLLLFVAVFYLGPAFLKSYQGKKNIQTALPEPVNSEIMHTPPKVKKVPAYMVDTNGGTMEVKDVKNIPAIKEEKTAWSGKLDHNMLVNGVIFAEILQPPRAYRPFGKRE